MSGMSSSDTPGRVACIGVICLIRPVFGAAESTEVVFVRECSSALVRYRTRHSMNANTHIQHWQQRPALSMLHCGTHTNALWHAALLV
jgi:hypothetical protein